MRYRPTSGLPTSRNSYGAIPLSQVRLVLHPSVVGGGLFGSEVHLRNGEVPVPADPRGADRDEASGNLQSGAYSRDRQQAPQVCGGFGRRVPPPVQYDTGGRVMQATGQRNQRHYGNAHDHGGCGSGRVSEGASRGVSVEAECGGRGVIGNTSAGLGRWRLRLGRSLFQLFGKEKDHRISYRSA